MITELFPVSVGTYKVPALSKEEVSFVKSQTTYSNVGNKTSKQTFLLDESALSGVKKELESFLLQYLYEVYQPRS